MEYNYPGKVVHYDELPKLMNDYNKGVGMKVYVYKSLGNVLLFSIEKHDITVVNHIEYSYFGEIDLDIQQPKKTVRKEVEGNVYGIGITNRIIPITEIPPNAKNIKITYEVDE